jgi:ABC-type nitrate/sulfonate/bicarbonate transport system ATPase subunit
VSEGPLLEVDALTCGYRRDQPLLDGVSFAVHAGETVVLVGPSGCGKTTLLKTILGLVQPLRGDIHLRGVDGVGYVPQGLGLVRHASALRNVLLGTVHELGPLRSLFAAFPAASVERAHEALGLVGLAHKARAKPVHLSGGERRRVALARAIAQRPSLLLADEMLSELDNRTKGFVLDAVGELQRTTRMGILMVEHDIATSCEVGDLVCCLGGGTISAALRPGPQRERMVYEAIGAAA